MKKIALYLIPAFLLASCASAGPSPDSSYSKVEGNDNFNAEGNLIVSDFPIDGILAEEDYANASLTIHMGGTADFETEVTAQLVFGENGLTVGFYSKDKYISSSINYTDPQFVVNSDNVEFYIDTLNDKSKKAQSDDYAFLINPEEYIEMRTGTGSYWSTYSGVVDYAVKVDGTINDDSDVDVGWGCEIYLPYQIFGFTQDSVIGVAFGCRDKKTYDTTSKWTGWGPDPQIIETYVSVGKDGIVPNVVEDLTVNNGGFEYQDGEYVATSDNALGTLKNEAMTEGTFSVDMYLSYVGQRYDNGITLQVSSVDDFFWERAGVSYYFFAITHEGNALLGHADNGGWRELAFARSVNYVLHDWNNMKVILANGYFTCFLNEEYLFAAPVASLEALPFGLRAAMSGIRYRNIVYSASTEGAYVPISGYHATWGEFEFTDETETQLRSNTIREAGAMIISTSSLSDTDTLETTVKAQTPSDNGIVFKLDDGGRASFWEHPEVSYYFFFISVNGEAYLGRVLNGGWTNMSAKPITGYDINHAYTLKVEYTPTTVKCYVNGELRITVTDDSLTGTKYGYRAGSVGVTFTV